MLDRVLIGAWNPMLCPNLGCLGLFDRLQVLHLLRPGPERRGPGRLGPFFLGLGLMMPWMSHARGGVMHGWVMCG